MTPITFILGLLTLAGGVVAVSLRNLVHCALCLIVTFVCIAGLFLKLNAQFVGFAQILSRNHLRLRVWERGVGETRACGTGACAAMAAGRHLGRLDDSVMVDLPGGRLRIDWPGPGEPLWMTGPAVRVFEGTLTS